MRPELLSPAGSPEALRAAVQCGADAVYLGWGSFNARRNAKNFTDEELAWALAYCHERGVKVYLTLNTLLTDRELSQAFAVAAQASALGIDAVLVQDWGLFDLLRQTLPDLPLHASTQMSLFTSGGCREAAALGCTRVVVARECSRSDLRTICTNSPVEVEAFVHGALCMCYSGQCAMSALIGGRSGNRGTCAQPCRLPYGLDGPAKGHHPLSLKDSCLAGELADLAEMGVACLKLEGRMKRPEYVAVVTGIYARLLRENRKPTSQEQAALEQAFSRQGFTTSYWRGTTGPDMFGFRPENTAEPKELFATARAAYEKDALRTIPVRFTGTVRTGVPVELTVEDEDGHRCTLSGPIPEAARSRSVTAQDLEDRLKKTGGTAYSCVETSLLVEDGLSLSAAAVNALRRDALETLREARCAVPHRRVLPTPSAPESDCAVPVPELTVSIADWTQLTPALLAESPSILYLPLELLAARTSLPAYPGEWCVVLPRIWRDTDEPLLRQWLTHAQELGVASAGVGNLGHLSLLRGFSFTLRGDFGLNLTNGRSLAFVRSLGLSSGCLSFELRSAQLRDLPKPLATEAVVYGRLPMMITENCLVRNAQGCALGGPSSTDGAPCRQPHSLTDRTGAAFPLLPAFGHRTEVQNSKPLFLADRSDWKQLGLSFARLRFTTESPAECAAILHSYRTGGQPPREFTRGLYDRGVE